MQTSLKIPKINIFPSQERTAEEAAKFIIEVVKKKPKAKIIYATGNTMVPVYTSLWRTYKKGIIDFRKSFAFHLDEYYPCNPKESFSFVGFLKRNLFEPLKIPPKQIFLLNGLSKNPQKEAERYEKLISLQKTDLVVLGIGPGGHIGFNEKGSAFNSRTRLVNLGPETIKRDREERNQKSPAQALTVGTANILEAKKIILIAYGKEKGKLLKKALFGPISENYPSSALRLVPQKVIFFIDKEAGNVFLKNI